MDGWFTFGNIGGYLPDLVTNGVDWEAGMRHLVEVKNRFGKPVVAFSLCARSDYPCERVLREGGIPVFDSPDTVSYTHLPGSCWPWCGGKPDTGRTHYKRELRVLRQTRHSWLDMGRNS